MNAAASAGVGFESSEFPGRLVVVSGPSGVGKTALIGRLVESGRCQRAITATTRAPRAGEKNGEDYVFYDGPDSFRQDLEAGRFLEHADVHGELYGTPVGPLTAQLEDGHTVVLNIDVQGARTLMEKQVDATYVFIAPPSVEELRNRLSGRGSERPEDVALRLENAERELAERGQYSHCIVNDDFEVAIEELESVLNGLREPE